MSEQRGVHFDKKQIEGIEQLTQDGYVHSFSEGVRVSVNAGLDQLGYGDARDTPLRKFVRRMADSTAMFGVLLVGMMYFWPIGFRAWVIPVFALSIGFYLSDRVLSRYEPSITRAIDIRRSRV